MANEIHISGSGVTIVNHSLFINGNGINRTKIVADGYFSLHTNTADTTICISDCSINFSIKGIRNQNHGARMHNVLVDGATGTVDAGDGIVSYAIHVTGSTFQNCSYRSTSTNHRGVIDGYPNGGLIENCLFNSNLGMNAIFCYGTTVSGCTFTAQSINVYNRSIPTIIVGSTFTNTAGIGFGGWQITDSNFCWVEIRDSRFESPTTSTISVSNAYNRLDFYGSNVTNNVVVTGSGRIFINVGSVTGSDEGKHWRINLAGSAQTVNNYGTITGCTISGKSHSTSCFNLGTNAKMVNCLVTGNTIMSNVSHVIGNVGCKIIGSTIADNVRGPHGGGYDALSTFDKTSIVDSIIDACHINSPARAWIHFNNIWYPKTGYLYWEGNRYDTYTPSIRVEAGSTISVMNNTRSDTWWCMQTPCIAVGVQSSDGTFFANNGTFTFVKKNGTSIQIKGIGTYIQMNGVNDFSPIYQITSTAASGSGSLQYGIITATEKWLVPMPNIPIAGAVVSTAITNKPVFFMNAAGAPIFGGSISLPASTTVSCKYDNNIEASTVSVTGGTLTVSGTCYMRGSLIVNQSIVVAAGNVINGTGAASIINLSSAGHMEARSGTEVYRYIVIKNGVATSSSDSYGGGGGGFYGYGASSVTFSGCIIQNCVSPSRGGGIHCVSGDLTISNCTITGCRSGGYGSAISHISGNKTISNTTVTGSTTANGFAAVFLESGTGTITNCKFYDNNKGNVATANDLQCYSGTYTISGSTMNRIYIGGNPNTGPKGIFSGTNRISTALYGAANAIIEIQSGATINIQGMAINITAGTISILGACTIINTSGTATTVNAGTYTTISTAGVAS